MELFLELTRRCNLACSHCLRGNAQNQMMPEHIALTALQKLGGWGHIGIGGGEPLASVKLMKQLRHWLLWTQTYPDEIYMVSNGIGLLKSPAIMKAVNNLPGNTIMLHISTDQWHDEESRDYDAQDRYNNAKELAFDYHKIEVSSHGEIRYENLLNMGRRAGSGIEECIEADGNMLYVDVHGFVWGSCNLSYTFMKRFRNSPICFGNVLTHSEDQILRRAEQIEQYILNSNSTELLLTEHFAGVEKHDFCHI